MFKRILSLAMTFLKSLKKSASFSLHLCVNKEEIDCDVPYITSQSKNNFMYMGCLMGKYETKSQTSNCAPSFINIGRFSIGHQISSPKRKSSSWC